MKKLLIALAFCAVTAASPSLAEIDCKSNPDIRGCKFISNQQAVGSNVQDGSTGTPGGNVGGSKKGNNGHGNDPDGNDSSNPGNSNNGDGTDADGSPGNSGGSHGRKG